SRAKPLAVSQRRPRSFSSALITIQSSSPRTSFASLAGSVLRWAEMDRQLIARLAQPRARLRWLLLADQHAHGSIERADLFGLRLVRLFALRFRRRGRGRHRVDLLDRRCRLGLRRLLGLVALGGLLRRHDASPAGEVRVSWATHQLRRLSRGVTYLT